MDSYEKAVNNMLYSVLVFMWEAISKFSRVMGGAI